MKRKKFGRKEKKKAKEIKGKKKRHMQWIVSKVWKKEENQTVRFKTNQKMRWSHNRKKRG